MSVKCTLPLTRKGCQHIRYVLCTGGETMILQPQLLGSFWQSFQPGKGLELNDLITLVEPRFNQVCGNCNYPDTASRSLGFSSSARHASWAAETAGSALM